jgi:heme exporter protein A
MNAAPERDGPLLLEVVDLKKDYGGPPVLRSVSLSLKRGEGLILLGPNGAGKSTLLRILAGIHRAGGGTIRIGGVRASFREGDVRRQVGFVSHETFLYDSLTARENLLFFGRLYGVTRPEEIAAALEAVGLLRFADRPVGSFSRGMAQRLTLARARLHRPPLLLLDEPFTGLDPVASGELEASLRSFRSEGGSFVMATHDLAHVIGTGNRLLVLRKGQIVHADELSNVDPGGLEQIYRRYAGVGIAGAEG